MGQSIDKALITQFSDMVHNEAQQMKARLRPYVQIKKMEGDVFAYDGLGSVEAQELSGRVNKTEFNDIEHNRRKIAKRRFVVTLPIDGNDLEGMLLNPQGEYAKAVVAAMERQFDRVVIQAAFADVMTGREFDNAVTFDSEGTTVDATAGLTYEKLLEIGENFIDNEVGCEIPEQFFLSITGSENTALMGENELTSGDYTRQFAVEKGELVKAASFDLIKYGANAKNPILPVASGERNLIAASSRGICVGISKEIELKIQDRPDYVDVKQIQAIFTLGAVRTEGSLIQKVRVTA
jgi:hypothetical protein